MLSKYPRAFSRLPVFTRGLVCHSSSTAPSYSEKARKFLSAEVSYNTIRYAILTGQVVASQIEQGPQFAHKPAGLYALGMEATFDLLGLHEDLMYRTSPAIESLREAFPTEGDEVPAHTALASCVTLWLAEVADLQDQELDPSLKIAMAVDTVDTVLKEVEIPDIDELFQVSGDPEWVRRRELARLVSSFDSAILLNSTNLVKFELMATALMT